MCQPQSVKLINGVLLVLLVPLARSGEGNVAEFFVTADRPATTHFHDPESLGVGVLIALGDQSCTRFGNALYEVLRHLPEDARMSGHQQG